MSGEPIWTELEDLLDIYDADFEVTVATACCWSGQLRLTLTNPQNAPSRSITFYAVGCGSPQDVARRVLDDAGKWMAETNDRPMPVPDWMRA